MNVISSSSVGDDFLGLVMYSSREALLAIPLHTSIHVGIAKRASREEYMTNPRKSPPTLDDEITFILTNKQVY